ncbi:heat shock protein 70 kDa 12A [Rhizoctonia solani]|uniref:Heat shock protein 70 kDa 12A n=1 Tax=Rhizoctonia solani TaxID=456999 RepID=A0A8H8P0V4_9AGAM|nr:heat shock protein 70 kDa 12A [Rhizoctonia solani]QRW21803.1 heat shock protein 70 kDa 12A [Rhizoctonia solani]
MAKRGGTSRPIQQALARPKPRQSAPRGSNKISSDEDDEPLPPPQQTSAPEPPETITIVSSGSGSNSPQPGLNTSPIRPNNPSHLENPTGLQYQKQSQAPLELLDLVPSPEFQLSSDAESQSSSEMVETLLAGQPEQKSIVLGSNSSTSENADDEKEPTEPEPEPLVESIANVSLYDELTGQDKESHKLLKPSKVSVSMCQKHLIVASEIVWPVSRKKKRKASDAPENVPAKRRTTALPLVQPAGTSRASPASGASTHSAQSQTSNRFIQRKILLVSSHLLREFQVKNIRLPMTRFFTRVQVPPTRRQHPAPDTTPDSQYARSATQPPTTSPRRTFPESLPIKAACANQRRGHHPGDELVTWRVDLVNSMPDSYRKSIGVRVFEAYMDDAMRLTEPCASAIQVENMVDSEPCPPWEFVYYNTMLYGTNVPKLIGCAGRVRFALRYYAEYGGDMDGTTGFGCAEDGTIKYQNGRCLGVIAFAKENIPAGRFIANELRVYDNFGRTYVLNFTRFFNHSCEPNLKLTAYYCDDVDIQKPLIALFTCVDVKAGSELTFSYTGLDVYDEEAVSFGADAVSRDQEEAQKQGWTLAKEFKLHLQPVRLRKKFKLEGYIFEQTKICFEDRIIDGKSIWEKYMSTMQIVIGHPNGWSNREQAFLRNAAVKCGVFNTSQSTIAKNISFVTEAEASVHYCIQHTNLSTELKPGSMFAVCDAGGSTVDTTLYSVISTEPDL